jgi:Domain of unknown function (DUF2017)
VGNDDKERLIVAPEFTRGSAGIRARLDREESELFRRLLSEMQTLLADTSGPNDLIKGRLYPSAYEDPEDERVYREMVRGDLERAKLDAVEAVAKAVAGRKAINIEIPTDQADSWLTVLTDMRLAIGTRLDVDEDKMSSEPSLEDPDAPALAVMHWLGWMQEMILEQLLTTADNEGGA